MTENESVFSSRQTPTYVTYKIFVPPEKFYFFISNVLFSVLCPETQNITSQYLALQQLDAHQKMVSRAKGL